MTPAALPAQIQDWQIPDLPDFMRSAILGLDGMPTLVRDDFGNWNAPLLVYSDVDLALIVPAKVANGELWLVSLDAAYGGEKQYQIRIYTFFKTKRNCLRELAQFHLIDKGICSVRKYATDSLYVNIDKRTMRDSYVPISDYTPAASGSKPPIRSAIVHSLTGPTTDRRELALRKAIAAMAPVINRQMAHERQRYDEDNAIV